MKGVWLNLGESVNAPLLAKHAITDVAFDIRDPQLDRAFLRRVQGQGFTPGVYACSQGEGWPQAGTISGPKFAEWVEARVRLLNVSQNVPFCHLNSESHDVSWLIAMLTRWRSLRTRKRTLWGMEGMQGGLFSPANVALIEGLDLEYGPQAYTDEMTRMESASVVKDLIAAGFSADRIFCFLDAAQLGYWWNDAWAFTQGRLPA